MRATTKAAKDLSDLLFGFVFTGEDDCTCHSCQTQSCSHTNAKRCPVQKGQKTIREKAKEGFAHKSETTLQALGSSDPDQRASVILDFTIDELKNGVFLKMKNEIQGPFANLKGRNTENNLTARLERMLQGRRGLLLNGFNVKENLKLFFDAFNIQLTKDRKEIEHDVLHMAPHKDKVLVNFVQAKSQLNVPWTEKNALENARAVIKKACEQGAVDVETFSDIASFFLTEDQFKLIDMSFTITMSDLSQVPETDLCLNCRGLYVYDEDRGRETTASMDYNSSELKTIFKQPAEQESATSESEEIFEILAAIYAGGGSLVKLKSAKEKFKSENFSLQKADKVMQKVMSADQPLDKTTARRLNNVKPGVGRKWISRNLNIKLSPAQTNLYNSRIGLNNGYCMIGGHGTGKTMMILASVPSSACCRAALDASS